jgi:hypothetical protein
VLTDFAFVCGESWRSEPADPPEKALALYSATKEPVVIAVARLYSQTLALFTARYPAKAEAVLLPDDVKKVVGPAGEELTPIKARLLYRMMMFREFLGPDNRPLGGAIASLAKLLKEGDRQKLAAFLGEGQNASLLDSACALPPGIRGAMGATYVAKGKDAAAVVLVNPAAPRFLVACRVLSDAKATRPVTIEPFDLELSAKVLELRKEVK